MSTTRRLTAGLLAGVACAVLGTTRSIDAALTFALLWFHYCRNREAARCFINGLKLFVPQGSSAVPTP